MIVKNGYHEFYSEIVDLGTYKECLDWLCDELEFVQDNPEKYYCMIYEFTDEGRKLVFEGDIKRGFKMYINTVESLKDSFTDFKRVVYAYVWAYVKEYVYTETEETYKFIFRQFAVIAEDEVSIKDKAENYLRSAYSAGGYIITNIIPYKEVLTRELRKGHCDVLDQISSL